MEKQTNPDALDRALTDLYGIAIPDGYRAGWRAAIRREERIPMKQPTTRRNFWRVALPVAAALVLVIGALTAGNLIPTVVTDTLYSEGAPLPAAQDVLLTRGAGDTAGVPQSIGGMQRMETDTQANESMAAMPSVTPYSADNGAAATPANGEAAAQGSAKIVRTAEFTLATNAFEQDTQALEALAGSLGGYVSSVSASGEASSRMDRVAYYSLRIPSDRLNDFLRDVAGIGRVTSRYETATDMSTQYADTELRLTTQTQKMARLQQLLTQATDVSDLLEIESEIADTQYSLDSLESSLRAIDRDVAQTEVSVTLREQSAGDTAQAVELTLWQRIGGGFVASLKGISGFLQNLLVFLALALPAAALLAVVVLLGRLVYRAFRKDRPAQPPVSDQPPADRGGTEG